MSEETTRQFPCLVLASHGYVSMLFCLLTFGNARADPLAVTNTVLERYLLLIYGSRERCRNGHSYLLLPDTIRVKTFAWIHIFITKINSYTSNM